MNTDKMSELIFVQDYPVEGMNAFGTIYPSQKEKQNRYWMDNCDLYTIKELEDEGYTVIPVPHDELLKLLEEHFKK